MQNDSLYRHFLICNTLANAMMGHLPQNHAKLMVEEDNGRFGNAQMTWYFKKADIVISNLIGYPEGWIWDELDMDEVAELSIEQIEEDYQNYCNEKLSIVKFEE